MSSFKSAAAPQGAQNLRGGIKQEATAAKALLRQRLDEVDKVDLLVKITNDAAKRALNAHRRAMGLGPTKNLIAAPRSVCHDTDAESTRECDPSITDYFVSTFDWTPNVEGTPMDEVAENTEGSQLVAEAPMQGLISTPFSTENHIPIANTGMYAGPYEVVYTEPIASMYAGPNGVIYTQPITSMYAGPNGVVYMQELHVGLPAQAMGHEYIHPDPPMGDGNYHGVMPGG